MRRISCFLICLTWLAEAASGQQLSSGKKLRIIPGADRTSVYVPLLKGKRVAVFANNTSMIGDKNIVDTLVKLGVDIRIIFGPEHGFRGQADAGAKVDNGIDPATGIPVVSLYGKKTRPSKEDLKNVDVMLFDIQDVGVRFYTYISSLQEYMETAIENKIPFLLLDRPDPNGFYVDGPVLDTGFRSFVGMQPVPIVYGMTIGEYAMMIAGEQWLSDKANSIYHYYQTEAQSTPDTPFHFLIIKCQNYTHKSRYVLPVKPSPNLPDIQSIYLYPSTCFFEGTVLSEGRGTTQPFQVFGHPLLPKNLFHFTAQPMPGATDPKLKNQLCYGWNLGGTPQHVLQEVDNHIQLKWLIRAYRLFPDKDNFFLSKGSHFNRLAGTDQLMQQIQQGVSEKDIRASWEPALSQFKKIRKKYLLYEDF